MPFEKTDCKRFGSYIYKNSEDVRPCLQQILKDFASELIDAYIPENCTQYALPEFIEDQEMDRIHT